MAERSVLRNLYIMIHQKKTSCSADSEDLIRISGFVEEWRECLVKNITKVNPRMGSNRFSPQ